MLTKEDREYLQDVLFRYEQGTASAEEVHFVEAYFNYLDTLNQEQSPFAADGIASREEMEQTIREKLMYSIKEKALTEPRGRIHRLSTYYRRIAAAALFLIICAVSYWLFFQTQKSPVEPVADLNAASEIRPGSNRAMLTTSDGQTIVLDSNQGNILQQEGLTVRNQQGQLYYEGQAADQEFHTLSVPNGGQYQLHLPDGSAVWLNSASSIRYPAVFAGAERRVEITGEVYFEVAPNKQQPFKVTMPNDAEIEVLGTHFNINTYADEPAAATTLLEGAIRYRTGGQSVELSPGQQVQSTQTGNIQLLRKVDTDAVMSWKEGYFNFNGADLSTVMRQVARWYNVTVKYEGRIPDMKFSGEIARSNNASMVLKMLEAANVHFEIQGSVIIVKQ